MIVIFPVLQYWFSIKNRYICGPFEPTRIRPWIMGMLILELNLFLAKLYFEVESSQPASELGHNVIRSTAASMCEQSRKSV